MKPIACKTVMIVDDSPIVRERLVSLVSEIPGVEVIGEADRAQAAIEALPRLKPSVLVLDMSMPGGSGLVVLEFLKETKLVPVIIVLTNYAHDLYCKQCLKLGATYFFDKSSQFEEVKCILERLTEAEPVPAEAPVAIPKAV